MLKLIIFIVCFDLNQIKISLTFKIIKDVKKFLIIPISDTKFLEKWIQPIKLEKEAN